MIAATYISGEPVREGDIVVYYTDVIKPENELTVASFSDFLRKFPEEGTSPKYQYVPFIDSMGILNGWTVNAVVFLRRANEQIWKEIEIGERVSLTINEYAETHTFLVEDYYDDPVMGRVLQSRFHSYAQNDGWIL